MKPPTIFFLFLYALLMGGYTEAHAGIAQGDGGSSLLQSVTSFQQTEFSYPDELCNNDAQSVADENHLIIDEDDDEDDDTDSKSFYPVRSFFAFFSILYLNHPGSLPDTASFACRPFNKPPTSIYLFERVLRI